jgi:hypothetical protein
MRRQLIRQFTRQLPLLALLSFCTPGIVAGHTGGTNEVEQALAAIGSGSAEELKDRLFTHSITVFNAAQRAQAIAALPASTREQRITQGKVLRGVETVFQQTLQLHRRGGKVELFLFRQDAPLAQLWRGCVLMLSEGLADTLYDGELAGIIAHELGHSYSMDEMVEAQRVKDAQAMRVIELKCDAVAIVSLKLLGHNPAHYLRGLKRVQEITRRKSLSRGVFQSHPELHARAEFAERLITSLAAEGRRR